MGLIIGRFTLVPCLTILRCAGLFLPYGALKVGTSDTTKQCVAQEESEARDQLRVAPILGVRQGEFTR